MPNTTQKETQLKLQAFEHWCNSQNYTKTAEHFSIGRNTVIKIAKEDNWQSRFAKIHKSVLKKQETSISNRIVENLKHIRLVKRKILAEMLKKTGKTGASVSDLVKLFEYEDKAIALTEGRADADPMRLEVTFKDLILNRYEAPIDSNTAENTEAKLH